MLRTLHALFALCLLTELAPAQSYVEPFDVTGGWTLTATNPTASHWAVDAAGAAAFAPFHSAPASLNYNDDAGTYGPNVITAGTATSPPIDLSVFPSGSKLTFWEAFFTETAQTCEYDVRFFEISNDGFLTTKLALCMNQVDPITFGPSHWHFHSFDIDPAWGVVEVRFTFDTVDAFGNFADGWFIDDLRIDGPFPPTSIYCTAKVNSLGCTPFISTIGEPSTLGGPFAVRGNQLINNKMGGLIYGSGQAATPFYGGTLCIQNGIKRTPAKSTQGNPPPNDCSGLLIFNFSTFVASGVDPSLVVGTTVCAQFWYRDGPSVGAIGLTDAIEFTLQP